MFNQLKKLLGFQEQKQAPTAGSSLGSLVGALAGGVTARPSGGVDPNLMQHIARRQPVNPNERWVEPARSFSNNPQTVANLTPATEDGYDTTIKYLNGFMPQQQTADYIPGNFSGSPLSANGYQGGNPFANRPMRNVYHNINPNDLDTQASGPMIQAPSFSKYPRIY